MLQANPWNAERAEAIVSAYAGLEGPLLPILHALQTEFGHLDDSAAALIAKVLNLTRAEVHGVITFYHDFRHAPPGRHVLKLCRGESCQSMGSEALAQDLLTRLGIGWHSATPDGALTVEPVYCLGLCACSPAALLDGEPIARLDAESLALAVDAVRA
jgi:formate dehydrogenase subunit gamma